MDEGIFREQMARWENEYTKKGTIWRGPQSLRLDLPSGGRVLELGCGNGKTLSALIGRGAQVCGLDFSPAAIKSCSPLSEWAWLVLADATLLPFVDRSFRTVLAFHLLEHLSHEGMERCSREIMRVLVPGGKLLVRALSTRDMRWGKGEEIETNTFLSGSGIVTHFFEAEELGHLFRAFEVRSLREEVKGRLYSGEPVRRAIVEGEFLLPD